VAVECLFQNHAVSWWQSFFWFYSSGFPQTPTLAHDSHTTFTEAPNLSMQLLESFLQCIKSGTIFALLNSTRGAPILPSKKLEK